MSSGDTIITLPRGGAAAPPRRPAKAADETAERERDAGGTWPHTTRLLPWSLAAFLTLVWLVPFDSITLPVRLPFESNLDRIMLGVIVFLWLAAAFNNGRERPRIPGSFLNWALGAFLLAALVSVIVNVEQLAILNEISLSVKKLALLVGYVAFFFLVTSIVRPEEVPAFVTFVLGLACVAALGTIVEYRLDYNVFFQGEAQVLPGGLSIGAQPADDPFGRASITGPTLHGLVIALMLTIAFALAVTRLVEHGPNHRRWLWAGVTILILAGTFATGRKTALIVPVVVVMALVALRPRYARKLLPVGIVALLAMPVLSPGAVGSIRAQLQPDRVTSTNSTTGRTQDYAAVQPDLANHPVIGRGYGSYDPAKYRIIDNQYIGLGIETGFIGVGTYLLMLIAVFISARPAIRSGDPARAGPAMAAACSAAALGVAAALFDVFAYPQVPYVFLSVAALAVVASSASAGSGRPGVTASSDLRA
jgi:hypothetical protein